jgi:hypothetical protein
MISGSKKTLFFTITIMMLFAFLVMNANATDTIVGQWNYSTSNHWAKGPVPAGSPSKGIIVITQAGSQYKMEIKSGMVFSPPSLKYFTGIKKGQEYIFTNSARVDNEGGFAKNTCTLTMISGNTCKGKSFSSYTNGGITFSWGFDMALNK